MSGPSLVPAATPHTEKPASERRRATRYVCYRQCLVQPEGATGVGNWPGITSNVSATGICLALPLSIAVGGVLLLEPWGPKHYGTFRARVVRSWMESFVWFHGCEFLERLTDEQLNSWLSGVLVQPFGDDED